MNNKFLLVGSLVGAIFLFLWGGILHSATPLPIQGLNEFRGSALMIEAIRAAAGNGNGVYFAKEGVWAAVALDPGGDRTAHMGSMMVKEVVTDLLSAFFLCLLMLAVKCTSAGSRAGVFAIAALAASMENQVSDWNWYGFSAQFSAFEAVDLVGSWFVLGFILSALRDKFAAKP